MNLYLYIKVKGGGVISACIYIGTHSQPKQNRESTEGYSKSIVW